MADASIVVDTRLDNRGFQSGSNQMRSAINGLQTAVNNFGQQAQANISAIAPALQNVARQAQTFSSSMTEAQFQKNLGSMANAVDTLQGKIISLQQRANQGFKSDEQAIKWQSDLAKVQQEMTKLQGTILAVGQVEVKSEGYTRLESDAAKLEAQLEKLYDRQGMLSDLGVDENSNSWKRLSLEIENAQAKLEDVRADMQSMIDSGTAFAQGNQTGAYSQLFMGADQAANSLRNLSNAETETSNESQKAASSASGFGSMLRSIGSNAATIAHAGLNSFVSGVRALGSGIISTVKTAISGLASAISATLGAAISGAKMLISGFTTALATMGRTAVSTASFLAKLPFKTITAGANMAKKALSAFSNKTKSTTLTSNGLVKSLMSVKRMLITRVKRMFISAIFKSVQASLHNIAKASDEFNRSMSNIKNSATTMGGNLAVTFSNLVNAVAPALSTIINWLSTAISYINAFFALLSGKSSVMVAKNSTDDYAKSLKSASGAAKDLNHQIYGFDELTKQESESGGGGGSTGATFEEKDIANLLPESIQNLFNSIKDAIANQNWEQVGELVADGLNWVVASIDDWINNKLRPFGVEWAGNIARILNGLVDKFDFEALGKMFADGLNAIIDIGYTFLTTFDWARLGEQLANGVNSIFDNIDWELLGSFFAAKWNALIVTVSNFFKNLDWADIGSDFAVGLNTFVNSINWRELSEGITAGLNGITEAIQVFIRDFDWHGLATQFKESVNSIIENVDWAELIYTIALGFHRITSTFYEILAGINWAELAKKFADGVNKIFSSENGDLNWKTLATHIKDSINNIVTGVRTFLETVDWDQMAKTFADGINEIITGVDWASLVWTIVLGFFRITLTIATTLASIDWGAFAKSFADGINKVFGKDENGNPNLDWDKLTKGISGTINGIVDGIRIFLETTDWGAMAQTFANGINGLVKKIDWANMIFTLILGLFSIVSTIASTLANIKWDELAVSFANGINKIFGKDENGNPNLDWDKLTSDVSMAIDGIVSGIRTFIETTNWGDIAQTFADGVNGLISKIDWANLIFTLFLGIYTLAQTLLTAVANIKWDELGASVAEGINKVFGKDSSGQSYIDWSDLGKKFSDAVKGIITGIDEFITKTDWDEVGKSIGDALGNVDWLGIGKKLFGLLWDALWAAATAVGGLAQRLIELIFGKQEDYEHVEVPDVFSGEVERQLQEQAGKAGELAADNMMYLFTQNIGQAGTEYDAARTTMLATAAALGIGFQDEFTEVLSNNDWGLGQQVNRFSAQANELLAGISLDTATVEEIKKHFGDAGISVTDGFAESIRGKGTENIGAALMLLAMGVDQSTIAALDTTNLHANLMEYMNSTGKDLQTVAGELATDTGDAMGRLMPEGMIQGYEAGKTELESKADELEDLASTKDSREAITGEASTTGEAVDTNLVTGMQDNSDKVGDASEEVTEEITDPLAVLPDNVKPYAETMMAAITQAIANGDPVAVEAIKVAAQAVVDEAAKIMSKGAGEEITKAFIDGWNNGIAYNYSVVNVNMGEVSAQIRDTAAEALSRSNGSDIGEAFVYGIDDGLANNYSGAVTDAGTIGSDVLAAVQAYINESNGKTIGENMLIGMINGFYAYGQTLVDVMAEICNVCAATAREILGIASPSKVFEQIGGYVMEGMQIGLEDTGEDAISTVGDIASAMVEEAENGNGISVQIDAMTDGLDTVTDKLARIADIFIGITDSIAQMGGLPLPAIASGQVIPYGAQAAGNATGSTETGLTGLEDALYNAITRSQSGSSEGDPVVIKLEVDGRTIADVVTKYQRQQSRAWG